jgi:hypothetical protein
MKKLIAICAVITMLLTVSGVAQASVVPFNFDPVDFFNYRPVSEGFSKNGGMFEVDKIWVTDRYCSYIADQRTLVDNWVAGLGTNEGICKFNIWLAGEPNAPQWGETLISSGTVKPTGWAPTGWTAEVIGNPWPHGENGKWLVQWSTSDHTKYIRPGNSAGEFGFTFEPGITVTYGQNYTIWFGGWNYGYDASLIFDSFRGGFPSQFVEAGPGSGFDATLSLTAIPEPATVALLALGAFALRRRRIP